MLASSLEHFDPLQYTIFSWLVWVPGLLIAVLRLVVRYRQLNQLLWDDAFAISGLVCLTIMAILNQCQRDYIYMEIDLLSDPTALRPPFTTEAAIEAGIAYGSKLQFTFVMFFWTCLWSIKGSLLIFYRRLLLGVNGYMKWWWAVVVFCILTWLASLLTNFLSCIPLWRRWSFDPAVQCSVSHGRSTMVVATVIDISSDILVMILPIRLLFGLRISTKQKIGVGGIFCLGFGVIIFAIIRMVSLLHAIVTGNANAGVALALWSMLECSVAVITGSLPTLKSLIRRKGDTNYSSGPIRITRGTLGDSKGVNSTKGNHIRLYDMQSSGVQTKVHTGYESDEALHQGDIESNIGRITKKQEISISSQDASGKGDERSIESFHHARGLVSI